MHLFMDKSSYNLASPFNLVVGKSRGANSAGLRSDVIICASRAGNASFTVPDRLVSRTLLTVSSLGVDIGVFSGAVAYFSSRVPYGA